MKVWKVKVKSSHSLWSFMSPESLYIWKIDGSNFDNIDKYDNTINMMLKKGDTLFIEWKKTEYVYDDKYDETFDLKMFKLTRIRIDSNTLKETKHSVIGWVSDEIISLNDTEIRMNGLLWSCSSVDILP